MKTPFVLFVFPLFAVGCKDDKDKHAEFSRKTSEYYSTEAKKKREEEKNKKLIESIKSSEKAVKEEKEIRN